MARVPPAAPVGAEGGRPEPADEMLEPAVVPAPAGWVPGLADGPLRLGGGMPEPAVEPVDGPRRPASGMLAPAAVSEPANGPPRPADEMLARAVVAVRAAGTPEQAGGPPASVRMFPGKAPAPRLWKARSTRPCRCARLAFRRRNPAVVAPPLRPDQAGCAPAAV